MIQRIQNTLDSAHKTIIMLERILNTRDCQEYIYARKKLQYDIDDLSAIENDVNDDDSKSELIRKMAVLKKAHLDIDRKIDQDCNDVRPYHENGGDEI
jgi:hypothetical protein